MAVPDLLTELGSPFRTCWRILVEDGVNPPIVRYAATGEQGRANGIIGTTVVSGVTTVAVTLDFRFAAGQPELQGAVEMAASLIAVLAALLAFARLRRRRDLTDLALASALSVIALSNVFFAVFSAVAGGGRQ